MYLSQFIATHQTPYPLMLKGLSRSGVTAFFTRSSAANIPVTLELCGEPIDRHTVGCDCRAA
ncbi:MULTISPECIES: hypothetical protein [Mogibacterium]|uniref:hypothetical protein n=1 Tax=Mogibacterium TaxID=86331 RepID=UPI00248CC142|nr:MULTISPECIES: hypothetical protein [Mogibacterium]